jgi:RecA-family ATPase
MKLSDDDVFSPGDTRHDNFVEQKIPIEAYIDDAAPPYSPDCLLADAPVRDGIVKPNVKSREDYLKEKFGYGTGSTDWEKPYEWAIENLIPAKAVGMLGGPSASGKTFLAIELAGAIVTGNPAFGTFEVKKPGGVLYVAVEGRQGLAHRFEAYRRARNIPEELGTNASSSISSRKKH